VETRALMESDSESTSFGNVRGRRKSRKRHTFSRPCLYFTITFLLFLCIHLKQKLSEIQGNAIILTKEKYDFLACSPYPPIRNLAYDVLQLFQPYKERNVRFHVVQIGAADGDWQHSNDPVQKLIFQNDLVDAILVEPVPSNFKDLQRVFKPISSRVKLLKSVISNEKKQRSFYYIDEQYSIDYPHVPHWARKQLGSFNKNNMIKRVENQKFMQKTNFTKYVKSEMIQPHTGKEVVEKFNLNQIDMLVIDTEGADFEVLNSFLDVITPNFIVFEWIHLQESTLNELKVRLTHEGYIYGRNGDSWDLWAIREYSNFGPGCIQLKHSTEKLRHKSII